MRRRPAPDRLVARERGIPHIYCTGNHDSREAFAAVLGTGHRGPDGRDVGRPAAGVGAERAAVSEVHARDPHAGTQVYPVDAGSGTDVADETAG